MDRRHSGVPGVPRVCRAGVLRARLPLQIGHARPSTTIRESPMPAPDPGGYHTTADLVASTDRMLRRFTVSAIAVLLVVSLTVIVWGAATFGGEVNLIKSRQLQFHQDTNANTAALAREATA